jgi:hypothetical protein
VRAHRTYRKKVQPGLVTLTASYTLPGFPLRIPLPAGSVLFSAALPGSASKLQKSWVLGWPTLSPESGNHHRETGVAAGYRRPLEMPRLEARLIPPTLATGKICNLEMPAIEVARSAGFFRRVFGRNIRRRQHLVW